MGNLNFDSAATEPVAMGFEPVPPGWYEFRVTNSEIKETKSGDGRYVKIEFTLENNRKHWENFNLWNPSEKAQQIGRGQFSSLCRACGKVGMVRDHEELRGCKGMIKLKITPAKDGYEARNSATEYKAIESAPAVDDTDEMPF